MSFLLLLSPRVNPQKTMSETEVLFSETFRGEGVEIELLCPLM
jgi:hypothetical protein